ncbi:unnamed protein product [Closterium sp. NIES-53]
MLLLVDFAAACRLDYAASLVAESASASVCPPSIGGECALGTDVLEDRQEDLECFAAASPHLVSMLLAPEGDPDAPHIPTPRSYAEAIEGPYSSQWQAAMDAEMASWKSTGTYVDEVPPPGANIVSGMWIFRVKRPPGSPPVFKARYVARGFSQRQGHNLPQGSLHEEIWLRRPPSFTGSFPAGTQWSLQRPVYGLRQAPREWHDTLRTTLGALDFAPSTADPSLFLRTDATMPPFYVLVYVDDLVFATADTEFDANGNIERYKSRLVAKGYQQKEKVDYKELFAPVVTLTTLRTLLAGATIKGWVVKQMDVTTAFLNGVLEEEIFMAQPEGFDDGSGIVLRLKKALYGLKQAPRQWYLKLRGVLEEIGFTPSTADHSLFMLGEGERGVSWLHIERDVEKRCMLVHQRKYLEALAANFGQSEGHVATPFRSGFKCVKGPKEESVGEEERRRFHSLVGSLMYAAVNT